MGPDPKEVKAIAICTNCGADKGIATFVLKVYSCGNFRAHCFVCDEAYEEAWASETGGEGQDVGGAEAVA